MNNEKTYKLMSVIGAGQSGSGNRSPGSWYCVRYSDDRRRSQTAQGKIRLVVLKGDQT